MKPRAVVFLAALSALESCTEELKGQIESEETDSHCISAFDEALECVMEARNAYCQAEQIAIENGDLHWDESEAQEELQRELQSKDKPSTNE